MLLFWIRGNVKILTVMDRLHLVVKVSYWPLFDHDSVYSSWQICTFVSAGRVRDCHVSIRNAVDTDDQRGDAARSVRRHQVLPLPGHFQTLRPSGTLGSTLRVQSSTIFYYCIDFMSLAGIFCLSGKLQLSLCIYSCVKFPTALSSCLLPEKTSFKRVTPRHFWEW